MKLMINFNSINGTLIWYYYICPREVWYINHKIVPDQLNENIEIGRSIDEYYYQRDIKKTLIDNKIQIDIIKIRLHAACFLSLLS